VRLFLAVVPPSEVLEAIAALPGPDEPGVVWVPAAQWHVTLRFLGEADPHEVADAVDATWPPPGALPARVELGPAVSRLGRTVVCLPARGLERLAGALRDATAHLGEPPDPRPFTGHLTLARLRRRGACGLAGTPFRASFEARGVRLVASELRADGARHTTVHRWHV
jgi:2'-5' RNA ligase